MTLTSDVMARAGAGRMAANFPRAEQRTVFEHLPGGGYLYVLPDNGVRVELRFLRREYGHLQAEVDVSCDWANAARHEGGTIALSDLNLSSQQARKGLATYCAHRAKSGNPGGEADGAGFDWLHVIDAACMKTIQAERAGDEAIILDDATESSERDISICGLRVPSDATSMLVAHGDNMKSMSLLFIGGTRAQHGARVLYLDWEWSADRHRARKRRLFGAERLDTLFYRRCRAPLTVEADSIRRFCDTNGIDMMLVDSLSLAAEGKLNDDDTAVRFHRALGTLPPAICAAYVPKSSLNPDAKDAGVMAFGSVYWTNLCRMAWHVRKEPGASEDVVTVGFFPTKQNDGERCKPVGLEFDFSCRERVYVRPVDLAEIEAFAARVPLEDRIAAAVRRVPLTMADLTGELGPDVKSNSIYRAIRRSSRLHSVQRGDGAKVVALKPEQLR